MSPSGTNPSAAIASAEITATATPSTTPPAIRRTGDAIGSAAWASIAITSYRARTTTVPAAMSPSRCRSSFESAATNPTR